MWQTRVIQAGSEILDDESGNRIKEATPDFIRWVGQDDKDHQACAPVLELGEGPDP
jgi:hypothetical protein